MYATRVFDPINAGLIESAKYPGLFYEIATQGKKQITYYYNTNGQIHNLSGPAIVTTIDGVVTDQKFVKAGNDYTSIVNELKAANVLELIPTDNGEFVFSESDLFTIGIAV